MNIIDAFKQANGKRIRRSCRTSENDYFKTDNIHNLLEGMSTAALLADDWEVERKPLVWEGEVRFTEYAADSVYNLLPSAYRNFIGKRTRIRIEEII